MVYYKMCACTRASCVRDACTDTCDVILDMYV